MKSRYWSAGATFQKELYETCSGTMREKWKLGVTGPAGMKEQLLEGC